LDEPWREFLSRLKEHFIKGLQADVDSTAYLWRVVIPQDEIQVVHAAGDYPVRKP
jgi:hypothetical protein